MSDGTTVVGGIEDAVVVPEVAGETSAGPLVQAEMFPLADITSAVAPPAARQAVSPLGEMAVGEVRFGVTATDGPIGHGHWLTDSSTCGDLIMALPSSVLVAGRSKESGGVAVDMNLFLDAVMEGTAKFNAYQGIADAASLPVWAVCRLFGTFPVLQDVYHEAMDRAVLIVEAAGMKAAAGMEVLNTRTVRKTKTGAPGILIAANGKTVETPGEKTEEETRETLTKYLPPDPTLSKLILTSRMKARYKDEGGNRQAVVINISGGESRL